MKKITLFILTIFTVATLYAAARPSLDGRAVVAESGTMPRGLFARTVGYLPGDSVTVTNPATGSTVDVLILGAIDPSEGVAILLSPEAADGLRIKPDSNVQVKLTKRSGSLDENANGSAVLSDADDDEIPSVADKDEENPVIAKNEPKAQMPLVTEKAVSEPEPEKFEERSAVAEKTPDYEEIVAKTPIEDAVAPERTMSEAPVVAENLVVEETPVAAPVIAKKIDEEIENPYDEEVEPETVYEILPPLPGEQKNAKSKQRVVVIEGEEPDYEEAEPYSEEKVQPVIAEKKAPLYEEYIEETPAVAETEKPDYDETESYSEEKVQPVAVAEVEPERKADEEIVEEFPAGIESEPAVVAEEEPLIEEPAKEEQAVAFVEEGAEPAAEEIAVAETPAEKESLADAYQPIVLVPAEPNPPVAEEKSEKVAVAEEEKTAPVEEKLPVVAENVPVVEEAPKMVVSNDWTNYVVPSVKNLRSGSYYVQVASLGNKDNIKNFVDKYSMKYPVVLVQTSSKNAYQVMVGPLNIDEYGAVGEKFKDYGFKDSFVRKIK